jgi:hypothetical protein
MESHPDINEILNDIILVLDTVISNANISTKDKYKKLKDNKEIISNYSVIKRESKTITDIFEYYNSYMNIISIINDSLNIAENMPTDLLIDSLKIKYNNLIVKLELAITNIVKNEYNIILLDELVKKLIQLINKIEDIDTIKKLFDTYNNTIDLYVNTLKILIKDSRYKTYISEIIIENKDNILTSIAKNIFDYKNLDKINPSYRRFNLLAKTLYMPLNKLLQIILSEQKKPFKGIDFKKLSKDLKIGFIIIHNVTYNPIYFDISSLLSVGAEESKENGINSKIVNRFDIVNSYSEENKNAELKWDFSYETYALDSKSIYIIETIDNSNYRVLSNSSKYYSNKEEIELFIKYITENYKPTRVSNHQSLCIKKALSNMFMPKRLDLELYDDKISSISPIKIRQDLFIKAKTIVNEIIENDYKNKVDNEVEITKIIHNDKFADSFYEIVLNSYDEYVDFNKLGESNKFSDNEIFVSFLVELNLLTRRYMKDLHDGYFRYRDKKIFDSIDKVKDKLYEIIEKTLDNLIRENANIYSAMYYKFLILNF